METMSRITKFGAGKKKKKKRGVIDAKCRVKGHSYIKNFPKIKKRAKNKGYGLHNCAKQDDIEDAEISEYREVTWVWSQEFRPRKPQKEVGSDHAHL